MKIDNGLILEMNTMIAPMYNSDYDGDGVSVFVLHSEQAKNDFKYAYVKNNIEFEHKDKLIVEFEHESIYSLFKLTQASYMNDLSGVVLPEHTHNNMDDFIVDIMIMIDAPQTLVSVNMIVLPYNIMVLNKAALSDGTNNIEFCEMNQIFYNEIIPKTKMQGKLKKILSLCGRNHFYDYMHNFDKFLLEAGTLIYYANPTYDSKDFIVKSDVMTAYKKTLVCEPYIGFHQNDIMFNDITKKIVDENPNNILSSVFTSGARIKSVQLLKAASNNGIPTDINGKAYAINIKESLLDGLPKYTFYKSSDSARLALAQRQSAIPKGGELQRKFYHETGFIQESKDKDCETDRFFEVLIQNKGHLKSFNGRYILNEQENVVEIIDIENDFLIGETVLMRSPIYCKSKEFKICKTCLGSVRPVSKNTGAAIGSYIPEAIIQSVLRTHHFSGAFITDINPEMIKLIKSLTFGDNDKIYIKTDEDKDNMDSLLKLLRSKKYYDDEDGIKITFDLVTDDVVDHCDTYCINIHDLPFNDDSVKQLHNIISYIDRNRTEENLISIKDMYEYLCDNITFPNGMYSIFIELIISILFYEDDIMLRYSESGEPNRQIALGRIIENLDPKLSIFHNFSKSIMSKIYQNRFENNMDHMHYELLNPLK